MRRAAAAALAAWTLAAAAAAAAVAAADGVVAAVAAPTAAGDAGQRAQFEAAFQGRCDRGSPCEQLCYDLHDGMYECDCRDGFTLREDGYSCAEINSTATPQFADDDPRLNEVEDVIYQKDAVMDAIEYNPENTTALREDTNEDVQASVRPSITTSVVLNVTTTGPRLEQKLTSVSGSSDPPATLPISTVRPCPLDCGPAGECTRDDGPDGAARCLCPLGRGGDGCNQDVSVSSPRFGGARSWLAFPALRGAYKRAQLRLELRPEAYDGVVLLASERDDMAGDFMALLLHQGFVEFRFDCGSGIGVVRSEETVLLNQWNHITLYRHRWDAWLQLNGGKHIQGRSKGLFSRITFREPLFVGGPGNATGLEEKLPVSHGLKGCVRHLEINDHLYRFAPAPTGEATKGYGVEECTADKCSKVPCQHGGKCLTSDTSAVCLCPLGFSGDLCEIRVDLQVPSFNGSSHLRYRGLGDSALTWLDVEVTLKPTAASGLALHDGHATAAGDFAALYLDDGYVAFTFDLGTGAATAASPYRVDLGEWHQVKVSRTGRLAILTVDDQPPVEVLAPGAFTQLSLPQNLYIGGVPNFGVVSPQISVRSSFVGCIQKVKINGRSLAILAEALGGANVDNCPHPCITRPCGEDGECIPDMDYFTCRCKPGYRDRQCAARGPPSFAGAGSYLRVADAPAVAAAAADPLAVNVRFRVATAGAGAGGLLLWAAAAGRFVSLGLERGALVWRFGAAGEQVVVAHNATAVSDGLWHRVKAVRDGSSGLLIVDNGPAITRQSVEISESRTVLRPEDQGLFVGGMPQAQLETLTRYKSGIRGCIADLVINTDYHLQLINRSEAGHNIGECQV